MNTCILGVQGINLYDRLKEEKVLGFKNNHFFKNTYGKRLQPLNNVKNGSLYRILTCP